MQPEYLPTPSSPLFRIGRQPNPLEWAPWEKVGDGRFDDPGWPKEYRVLYSGERLACLLEELADFRPDLVGFVSNPLTNGWIRNRRIANFSLQEAGGSCRWLDLRTAGTIQFLRKKLAAVLIENNLTDFDLSSVTSENLEITQKISRWAFDEGCCGIVYPTRFDAGRACWAIFERPEGARPMPIKIQELDRHDGDFIAVCDIHGLSLPSEVT
jgi:RES domain